MLKEMAIFMAGLYGGVLLKQRYRIPLLKNPLEEGQKLFRVLSGSVKDLNSQGQLKWKNKDQVIEKIKETERKYRN